MTKTEKEGQGETLTPQTGECEVNLWLSAHLGSGLNIKRHCPHHSLIPTGWTPRPTLGQ